MFTATSETALLSLSVLALLDQSSERLSSTALAGIVHSTPQYVSKVLVRLAERGFVEGEKGRGGGYRLARPASSIALAEVIEEFEALPNPMKGRHPFCNECPTPCETDHVMSGVCGAIAHALRQTSLESYATHCPNIERAITMWRKGGARAKEARHGWYATSGTNQQGAERSAEV